MATTDLAQCSKCAALLNDTDEDIAKHRRWHAQLAEDFEAVRRVASGASTDVANISATVRDLGRPVAAAAPATVSIRVTDDDELEPDADELAELTEPYAGEPVEDAVDDYPLAIDRPGEDDDLDTRLANATGQQPTI